ncbi:MAG: hypothetical protein AAF721_11610 [Myxococcota bacterium]
MSDEPVPELSDDAEALLSDLIGGMTPAADDEAKAMSRLGAAVTSRASRWQRTTTWATGLGVGVFRIAIPVLVIAVVILLARSFIRDDIGDAAMLQNARLMLEEQRYRGAYDLLKEHGERFKGRAAAEARTPLVLDALCGMGGRAEAEDYLRRYLEFAPESDLAARQRDVCPLGTEPARRLEDR